MTRSRLTLPTLTLTVVLAATTLSAGNQDLRRLFPSTAPVVTGGTGLARIQLSPEVLAACRSDLSDLRLLTTAGTEVPYVVLAAPSARAPERPIQRLRPEVVAAERHEDRPEAGPPVYNESYTVAVAPLPEGAAAWRLRLAIRRPELVCRIDVEARLRDGSHRTLVSGGSLFKLRRPRAQRLVFPLPAVEPAALEIRLAGENGGYAEPVISLEAMAGPPPPAPLEVPLAIAERGRHGDRTVVELNRPRGLVPARLRIGTSTPSFLRPVTVWDAGPEGERTAGAGEVYRLDAIAPVEQREIAIRPARGERLRLEITDGDSPPLGDVTCTALIPAPLLLFSPPADAGAVALYFGGRRTHRPHYDLEAFARGRRGAAAWNPNGARPATLGAVATNPAFDPAPALAFLMHPGAELSASSYSHRRSLRIEPSSEGLARLELTPADLALSRRDLADLRVTGGDDRQWPYLLVGSDAFSAEDTVVHRAERRAGESVYRVELPAAPLEISGMTVDSEAPFFDRPYRVVGTPPGGRERVLASGRLSRPRGRRLPIRVTLHRSFVERLELVIEDGGDAPLELTRIAIGIQHPALFIPAATGDYTLLLGNPAASAPRYEIAAARSIVLGVPAGAVEAGPLEPNPAYSASARLFGGGGVQQLILWAVLILAAIVLALLTLRLARKEEEEE